MIEETGREKGWSNIGSTMIESMHFDGSQLIQQVGKTANAAMSTPAVRDDIIPCTPAGADDAACLRQFIEQFGLRAYRRPLAADEKADLLALYKKQRATEIGASIGLTLLVGVPVAIVSWYVGVMLVSRFLGARFHVDVPEVLSSLATACSAMAT